MATEKPNVALVNAFFGKLKALDSDAMFAMCGDDLVYEILPRSLRQPALGKVEKAKYMKATLDTFASYEMEVKACTAQGDTVVMETTSKGSLKDGQKYGQDMVFLFKIRDGKIRLLHEFVDSAYSVRWTMKQIDVEKKRAATAKL